MVEHPTHDLLADPATIGSLMDFRPAPDVLELLALTERWLEPQRSIDALLEAQAQPAGYQVSVWDQCAELGLCSLLIDEAYGGTQMGLEAMCHLSEAFGRALLASPHFAHAVLASDLLNLSEAEALKAQHLGAWAMGETCATVASGGRSNWVDGTLSGAWDHVLHGDTADQIVLRAHDQSGQPLILLLNADAFERTVQHGLDQSRQRARLVLPRRPVDPSEVIASGEQAQRLLTLAQQRAQVVLAYEQLGVAQACLDASLEYAKTRRQFGTIIGTFQAIKHLIADLYTQLEAARSAAVFAAWCADHEPEQLPFASLTAAQLAGDAAFQCAGQNIQIHGGIGFTWEHPAHLYFKRAQSNQHLLGCSLDQLDQAARLLELEGGC